MRKMLLSLAVLTATVMSCTANNEKNTTHIKGKLEGLTDSIIVMTPTNNGGTHRDTVTVKDGSFDFIIKTDYPVSFDAVTPGTLRREEMIYFQGIAVPGETAEINGKLKGDYTYGGSKFYKEYNDAYQVLRKAAKPMEELGESLTKRMQAGENQAALVQEYQTKAPALEKQYTDAILQYIKEHPNQEAATALIPQLSDINDMKQAESLLSDGVKNGRMKSYYGKVVEQLEKRAEREKAAAGKQAAGVEAPDFTLQDINGKPLALSSLRGKYVVLDFWGSWCGWCIKGFPKMKEYYAKYSGKFEILGIACNDSEQAWKDAIKKHELPWKHVYNPQNSDVLEKYGIQGFPTKILVGPDGKIVKTYVGEDPAFYPFLDQQFGNK